MTFLIPTRSEDNSVLGASIRNGKARFEQITAPWGTLAIKDEHGAPYKQLANRFRIA